MSSYVRNQLRIKAARNKNAKYKLTYKTVINKSNISGELNYTESRTKKLSYKGN